MKEIIERRSIRKYKKESISRADIETILQAGIYSPSAKNRQPWKFYVYSEEKKSELLGTMESGLIRERDSRKILPVV